MSRWPGTSVGVDTSLRQKLTDNRVRNPARMICVAVILAILPSTLLPAQNAARSGLQTASPPEGNQASRPAPQRPGQLAKSASVPPLTIGDKFKYRIIGSFGVRGLLGNFASAAIGQAMNTPSEWGQGWGAYGERYASGLGGTLSRQVFAFTIESVLHEDPRYFPSEERTKGARVKNVLKSVIITHTDSGEHQFAYGRLISAFGAGQLVNVWQPRSNGHVSDGVERAFIVLGVDAGFMLMQEFLPFTRPKALRHRP
jgi:hypothetical protein